MAVYNGDFNQYQIPFFGHYRHPPPPSWSYQQDMSMVR